jgi:hypothetical protein
MKEEKMGRMKGDKEGESWSRSTTEVLKDTEKEEREMCMPSLGDDEEYVNYQEGHHPEPSGSAPIQT